MHLLYVSAFAWTNTLYVHVFGMDNLSDASIVRGCLYVDVHTVLVRVQCSAWTP